ncbi:MAG: hypothetical protein VKJ04_09565 [Vampirovibrionales bacterium]|nr:hypothetical protein [Vampirovibrionales bacterium]
MFSSLPLYQSHHQANTATMRFGQIELRRASDREGNDHGFLDFDLKKNPYRYYFTHQLNDTVLGPDPRLFYLHQHYEQLDIKKPAVQGVFKLELQKFIGQLIGENQHKLDHYSLEELKLLDSVVNAPYSIIRPNPGGDFTMTTLGADVFVRHHESAPLTGKVKPGNYSPNGLPVPVESDRFTYPFNTNPATGPISSDNTSGDAQSNSAPASSWAPPLGGLNPTKHPSPGSPSEAKRSA